MNNYEGLFIVNPDLKEEDAKNTFKVIGELVAKNSGAVKKEEVWGKKQLAYPVRKLKEGYYYKLDFDAPAEAISKIEAACKLNSVIIRVMISRK